MYTSALLWRRWIVGREWWRSHVPSTKLACFLYVKYTYSQIKYRHFVFVFLSTQVGVATFYFGSKRWSRSFNVLLVKIFYSTFLGGGNNGSTSLPYSLQQKHPTMYINYNNKTITIVNLTEHSLSPVTCCFCRLILYKGFRFLLNGPGGVDWEKFNDHWKVL